MISVLLPIERPSIEYLGKTTSALVPSLARALATMATILAVCALRSALVLTTGSWAWTSPITMPFGLLFSPPNPFMRALYLVIDSSHFL